MEDHPTDVSSTVAALRELIDALDRRVPHVERLGEARIAREAAALKNEALARIEELKRPRDAALANAVMTDDGGPATKDEAPSATGVGDSTDKPNRQTPGRPRTP
jgi:hypothetical protein